MRSRKANGSLLSPQNSLKIPHSRPRMSDEKYLTEIIVFFFNINKN